jgi:hypothetical protein
VWDCGAGFAARARGVAALRGAVGESLTVDTGRERIAGTFLDLDDGGALVMRDALGSSASSPSATSRWRTGTQGAR